MGLGLTAGRGTPSSYRFHDAVQCEHWRSGFSTSEYMFGFGLGIEVSLRGGVSKLDIGIYHTKYILTTPWSITAADFEYEMLFWGPQHHCLSQYRSSHFQPFATEASSLLLEPHGYRGRSVSA